MRVAPKVLVSMMSTPGGEVASWMSRITSGRVSDEQVAVVVQVLGVVLEPLAAIILPRQPETLDHRAHGAVEDAMRSFEQGRQMPGHGCRRSVS